MNQKTSIFADLLLKWHSTENNRSLPWKSEHDIYKVWLSEVFLQQTRAETVIPYYYKFLEKYPDIHELASAESSEVFALWQGLGYYNRCRNLLYTAKYISQERNGQFPDNYKELMELKGIGPYSAAAIASFGFHEDIAVVDGNVFRVLARVWNLSIPIDTQSGKAHFTELANQLLPKGNSASFNQAIMDFGAQICLPKNPQCSHCPLSTICKGFKLDTYKNLPFKSKKIIIQDRYLDYLVYATKTHIFLHQRGENDIWPSLWQPFLYRDSMNRTTRIKYGKLIFEYKQRLTHLQLYTRFYLHKNATQPEYLQKISWKKINTIALPKSIKVFTDYLQKNQHLMS